jgi:O-antigen/teichoic acid export membrane protein
MTFDRLLKLLKTEPGFILITSSTLISSSLGAAFFLYVATIVSVEDYGKINYLLSSAALAFAVSALGMDTTIMTYVPKRSVSVLYQANSLVFITSLVSALIAGVLANNFVVSILVLGSACYYMSTVQMMTQKRYKESATLSIGGKALQIPLSILLYFLLGINGFILGYAIAYFVFGYRFIFSLKNFQLNLDELKRLSRFSGKMYITSLTSVINPATTLISYLDKIIVGIFFGFYVLGSYQLSFQVFLFLSIMPSNIFRFLLPHEAEGHVVKKSIKLSGLAFACIISLIIIIMTPYVIPIVYPKYLQAILPIQIISLAIIPLTLVFMLQTKILSEETKTNHMLYAGLITTVSEISLLLILGGVFGLVGLAAALVTALTIQFLYLFLIRRGKIL